MWERAWAFQIYKKPHHSTFFCFPVRPQSSDLKTTPTVAHSAIRSALLSVQYHRYYTLFGHSNCFVYLNRNILEWFKFLFGDFPLYLRSHAHFLALRIKKGRTSRPGSTRPSHIAPWINYNKGHFLHLSPPILLSICVVEFVWSSYREIKRFVFFIFIL